MRPCAERTPVVGDHKAATERMCGSRASASAPLIIDISTPFDTSSGDVATITQDLATDFEACIAAHPTDWHMLQPQWIADLSAEKQARLHRGT